MRSYPLKFPAIIIFIMLIAGLNWSIFAHATWLFGDDHIFMISRIHNRYAPLFLQVGRFYPLGFQEFNILEYFPNNQHFGAYLFVTAFFFNLTLCALFLLASQTKSQALFWLSIATVITASGFINIYLEIIYPEKTLLPEIAFFAFFYLRFMKKKNFGDGSAAFIFAIAATYTKEPAFAAFMTVGGAALIFGWHQLTHPQKMLNGLLVLNGLIFLCLYYCFSYRHATQLYGMHNSYPHYFFKYVYDFLCSHQMLALSITTGIACGFHLLFRIKRPNSSLAVDVLACAAVIYTIECFILKLYKDYYFTPVYLFALPALIDYASKQWLKGLIIFLLCFVLYGQRYNLKEAIEANQKSRLEQKNELQNFITVVQSGKEMLWFDKEEYYRGQRLVHWKRGILEIMGQYLTGHLPPLFKTAEKIPDKLEKNQILIIPYTYSWGVSTAKEREFALRNPEWEFMFNVWHDVMFFQQK